MADTLYISGFTNKAGNNVVIIDKTAHKRIKKAETELNLFKNETNVAISSMTTDISGAKNNAQNAITISNNCMNIVSSMQSTIDSHTSEIASIKNNISILNDRITQKVQTVDSSMTPIEEITTDNGVTIEVDPSDHKYVFRDIN